MKTVQTFIITLAAAFLSSISLAQQGVTKYGENALQHVSNPTGIYNSAFGYYALNTNTTGVKNTAIGANVLRANNANYNTGVGYAALYQNTTGTENTAMGLYSLFANIGGYYNTATGTYSLQANTSGYYNTAIGYKSMYLNTDQSYNTALGALTLYGNKDGWSNTAIGYSTLNANTSGNSNTGIGHGVLSLNTSGSANTAAGRYALYNNTTGSFNTASGYGSLYLNRTGSFNTAAGYNSLYSDSTGSYNTANGINALYSNKTGSFNTALGYSADVASAGLTNATAIGYNAKVDASNKVRIGNTSVTSIGGQVGWSILSDGRYKANVKEDVAGLEFIKALRPVTYNLNVKGLNERLNLATKNITGDATAITPANDEFQKASEVAGKIVYSGFIAQEVEAAAQKINYDFSGVDKPQTKDGLYGLRYDNFIVPLVKAVQELAQQNEALKNQNDSMQTRITRLEEKLSATPVSAEHSISNSSVASLQQNSPNPFNSVTIIRYHIPASVNSAQLIITNAAGATVKAFSINAKGAGQVSIHAGELSAGSYFYTLLAEGRKIDSKQMMLLK